MSEGTVEGAEVTCPWHGATFDIRTGAVLGPPAGQAVKSNPVRVTGPDIEPVKSKSRREAKDWCAEHHSDPFIKEIGADSVRRRDQGQGTGRQNDMLNDLLRVTLKSRLSGNR